MYKILLVEDDKMLNQGIIFNFQMDGFGVIFNINLSCTNHNFNINDNSIDYRL